MKNSNTESKHMEDIPQPAAEPYSEGDTVTVYIGPDDTDTEFHGTTD